MHVWAGKDGVILHSTGFFILNPPEQGGLIQSLCRVEHLIILAWRLIGVKLNLFQVPDIISLIPGITRHLKLLSSGKADHTDYSPITFLLLSFLCPSLTHTHIHTTHIWTDVLSVVRGRFALSYRVRTRQLWSSRSIFGLLMDLFPFSSGAGLAEWSSSSLNLIAVTPPFVFNFTPPPADLFAPSLISPPLDPLMFVLMLCLHSLDNVSLDRRGRNIRKKNISQVTILSPITFPLPCHPRLNCFPLFCKCCFCVIMFWHQAG